MFMALLRILLGMLVACLVAGAVQVIFALTPSELAAAGPNPWQIAFVQIVQTAAAVALIGVPFVFLSGVFCEVMAVRAFVYHAIVGILIALAGFAVLWTGQAPDEPTLANSYAIATFITTGFLAGIAYWLVAGRFAGGKRGAALQAHQRQTRAHRRHLHRMSRRAQREPEPIGAPSVPVSRVTGSPMVGAQPSRSTPTQSTASLQVDAPVAGGGSVPAAGQAARGSARPVSGPPATGATKPNATPSKTS